MKRRPTFAIAITFTLLSGAFLPGALAVPAQARTPRALGSVTGRVLLAAAGGPERPQAGAEVRLERKRGWWLTSWHQTVATRRTGRDGSYRIDGVDAGSKLRVTVSVAPASRNGRRLQARSLYFRLRDQPGLTRDVVLVVRDAEARLPAPARAHGRLGLRLPPHLGGDIPLPNAHVALIEERRFWFSRRVAARRTDATGYVEFEGFDPRKEYHVYVDAGSPTIRVNGQTYERLIDLWFSGPRFRAVDHPGGVVVLDLMRNRPRGLSPTNWVRR